MDSSMRHIAQGVQEYLVANRARVGYVMKRPMGTATIDSMDLLIAAIRQGFGMDCSEAISLVMHVSGAKCPSGPSFNYRGFGDTKTMLDYLPNYGDAKKAGVAAIAIFNADQPLQRQHGAMVHTADPTSGNPLLFSHGTADGPGFITLAALQTGFSGKTAFLNVAEL